MERPNWLIGTLLGLFAFVSTSHILFLGAGVALCYRLGIEQITMLQAIQKRTGKFLEPPTYVSQGCRDLKTDFSEAVDIQAAIVLAILGGSGIAISSLPRGRSKRGNDNDAE
jgi:hypothetical protein